MYGIIVAASPLAGMSENHPVILTTASGRGVDTTIKKAFPSISFGEDTELLLQYDLLDKMSQKVYLRFDLNVLGSSRIEGSSLVLTALRGYHGRYQVNVFGVLDQPSISNKSVWLDAPGNDPESDGGHRNVVQNQGNGGASSFDTVFLGSMGVRPGDNSMELAGPDLLRFLNERQREGGTATLFLTRATPGSTSLGFASRENLLFSPPQLMLELKPAWGIESEAYSILEGDLGVDGEMKRLDVYWADLETLASEVGWGAVYSKISRGDAGIEGDQVPVEIGRDLTRSLARVLHAEVAFRALELTESEWGDELIGQLKLHPRRSDDLLYAYLALVGSRGEEAGGPVLRNFRRLLSRDLPAAARSALVETVADLQDPPSAGNTEAWLAHYRNHIPSAFGGQSEPYILFRYVELLRELEGNAAAAVFLDQTMVLLADDILGPTAALLKIENEEDESVRDSLVISMVDAQPASMLAEVLRPHYLMAMQRQGRLREALEIIIREDNPASVSDPVALAELIKLEELSRGSEFLDRLPDQLVADFGFGSYFSDFAVTLQLSEEYYASDEFGASATVALLAIQKSGIELCRVDELAPVTHLGELGAGSRDSDADAQAVAALLIAECYARLGNERTSRKWARDAMSLAGNSLAKGNVQLHLTKAKFAKGLLDDAAIDLADLKAMFPTSDTISALESMIGEARPDPSSQIRVERRIEELLDSARDSQEVAVSQDAYRTAVRLSWGLGYNLQAADILTAFAEQHASSDFASGARAAAIRLLESSGGTRQAETLRQQLVKDLGQSEAEALLEKPSSFLQGLF